MRATLLINGTDYSGLIDRFSYSVKYIERKGGNAGVALDGTLIDDVLTRKAVVTVQTTGLEAAALSGLLQELDADAVAVSYEDVKTGGIRTSVFKPEIGTVPVAFYRQGVIWYQQTTITLTEV